MFMLPFFKSMRSELDLSHTALLPTLTRVAVPPTYLPEWLVISIEGVVWDSTYIIYEKVHDSTFMTLGRAVVSYVRRQSACQGTKYGRKTLSNY